MDNVVYPTDPGEPAHPTGGRRGTRHGTRHQDLSGGLSQYYLDLSPYLSDPAYWEENFGSTLSWLRPTGDEDGIYGFQTQLTITGPFINRTLFEQAGVDVPSNSSDEVYLGRVGCCGSRGR